MRQTHTQHAESPLRAEVWAMLALAVPIVLTQLAQIALNTTDVIFTGWLGPEALAAGQLGHNLYFPPFITCVGMLFASSAMMAQELGGRRYKGVRRTFRQSFWTVAVIAPFAFIYFFNAETILIWLGQPKELIGPASDYVMAAAFGFPFALGFSILRNFIAAHSRPRPALYVLIAGLGVNAVADYVLMFGYFGFPRLELLGLGIATSIVQIVMFFVLLIYVIRDRRYRRYHLLARFWRSDWPRFRELWAIGVPIGMTKFAETTLFSASGFLVGLIAVDQLAGHAVALQWAAIGFMIPFGISQAATVRVGLAVGRKDPELVRRSSIVAVVTGVLAMTPSTLIYIFAGSLLTSVFLDVSEAGQTAAFGYAVSFLVIAGIFQFADGGQVIVAGALRGLKDTKVPMMLALISYWLVAFPISAWLGLKTSLGGEGVWIGMAIGLLVVWIALGWRLHIKTKV